MKKVTTLANGHDVIVKATAELLSDVFRDDFGLDVEKINVNNPSELNIGILKDNPILDMPEVIDQCRRGSTILLMATNLEREKCLALDRINRKLDKIIKLLKEEGS